MICTIKKEEPVFEASYSDYNVYTSEKYYISDVQKAEIGTVFEAHSNSNCGRAITDKNATLVYKDKRGALLIIHRGGTTDSPDPESWENDPEALWIEYGKSE